MKIFLLILFVLAMNTNTFAALGGSDRQGCMLKIEKEELSKLTPAIVPGTNRAKGTLKSLAVVDILNGKSDRPEIVPGDGFVIYCSCKTQGTSPVTILTVVEYRRTDSTYSPSFAFFRFEDFSDMAELHTVQLYASTLKQGAMSDISSIAIQEQSKSSTVHGKANGVHAQWHTSNPARSLHPNTDSGTINYSLSWKDLGKYPEGSKTAIVGRGNCVSTAE